MAILKDIFKKKEAVPDRPFTLLRALEIKLDKFIAHIDKEAEEIKNPEQRQKFESSHKYIRNRAIDLKGELNVNYQYYMQQLMQLKLVYGDFVDVVKNTLNKYQKQPETKEWQSVVKTLQKIVDSAEEMLEKKAAKKHFEP